MQISGVFSCHFQVIYPCILVAQNRRLGISAIPTDTLAVIIITTPETCATSIRRTEGAHADLTPFIAFAFSLLATMLQAILSAGLRAPIVTTALPINALPQTSKDHHHCQQQPSLVHLPHFLLPLCNTFMSNTDVNALLP